MKLLHDPNTGRLCLHSKVPESEGQIEIDEMRINRIDGSHGTNWAEARTRRNER